MRIPREMQPLYIVKGDGESRSRREPEVLDNARTIAFHRETGQRRR